MPCRKNRHERGPTLSTVLYIKANAKPQEESRTYDISDAFVSEYKNANPNDVVVTLDLYAEGVGPMKPEDYPVLTKERKAETDRFEPALRYAWQFYDADRYIFAAPQWNLFFPSILKCYLEYACPAGIAFHYTDDGCVGDLHGKKAIHITTRGGDYSVPPMSELDCADRYLRNFMKLCGVEDFTTISVDRLDMDGEDPAALVREGVRLAKNTARNW